jgi:hypothetical protein
MTDLMKTRSLGFFLRTRSVQRSMNFSVPSTIVGTGSLHVNGSHIPQPHLLKGGQETEALHLHDALRCTGGAFNPLRNERVIEILGVRLSNWLGFRALQTQRVAQT